MAAPLVSVVGRVALQTLAHVTARHGLRRAAAGTGRWSGPLAWLFGMSTLLAVSICAGIGATLQTSTLPWPVVVPKAGDEGAGWVAGGWQVSSGYGWRSNPFKPETKEFHDGVDLAGPPFCLHCRVPSLFDAQVRYLGWDPYRDRAQPADQTGGGIVVELETLPDQTSGVESGELVATYAHLAPYRLLVQLQGRIDDPWDREEFRPYAEYQELGAELLPAPDAAALTISCSSEHAERVPEFVPQRVGPASFVFLYDKPIVAPLQCTVAMAWPKRGEGWIGWIPEDPAPGPQPDTAVQTITTPIKQGVEAGDIAVRFRAFLTPPAPDPTPTALPYPGPVDPPAPYPAPADRGHGRARVPGAGRAAAAEPDDGCVVGASGVVCRWRLATIRAVEPAPGRPHIDSPTAAGPIEQAKPLRSLDSAGGAQAPDERCGRVQLVPVPARASDPRMTPDAAAAWHRADVRIAQALGYPWLREYVSDIMRPVEHRPTKPNQILESWHKTGRAVDVPQTGRGLRIVQEGAYQRLFVAGVDITAIMVEAGFERIPSSPARPEWWHFELRGGLAWQGAMAQVYPIDILQQQYPALDWSAFPCQGQTPADPGSPDEHEDPFQTCTEGVPSWNTVYEELAGCGPPLSWSTEVQTLDHVIGHVGLTGWTTGAHLHLGLRQRSGATAAGTYATIDVCEPPWLPDELRGKSRDQINKTVLITWKADCYTETVDPLDFLPRANAGPPLPMATAAPLDSAPVQLPPPGTDGALLMPVPSGAASPGEYWSPFGRYGRFGGGSVLDWLRSLLCSWFGERGFGCDSS